MHDARLPAVSQPWTLAEREQAPREPSIRCERLCRAPLTSISQATRTKNPTDPFLGLGGRTPSSPFLPFFPSIGSQPLVVPFRGKRLHRDKPTHERTAAASNESPLAVCQSLINHEIHRRRRLFAGLGGADQPGLSAVRSAHLDNAVAPVTMGPRHRQGEPPF